MNKKTIEEEKGIIDYSFRENRFGERLQAWDEGFETLGEKFRFRGWNNTFLAEHWRSHSGLSSAGNDIVISRRLVEKTFISDLRRERHFSLARERNLGISPWAGRIHLNFVAFLHWRLSIFIPPGSVSLLGGSLGVLPLLSISSG